MTKQIKMDEFRTNNNKAGKDHPAYIYAKVGKRFKFIGITHAPITKGMKNIPLDTNPNPKDTAKSYARPLSETAHQASFGKKLAGWRLLEADKKKLEKVKK